MYTEIVQIISEINQSITKQSSNKFFVQTNIKRINIFHRQLHQRFIEKIKFTVERSRNSAVKSF